jgi:hypothetical protein
VSCLCSILVSLLVAAGVAVLVLYLLFKPKMITATVDSASLATFNLSSSTSTLTYDLAVAMTVRNPNKRVGLYYDGVEALALYRDQRFGYAPLDSFYQATESSTKLTPAFRGQQLLQGDATAAEFRSDQAGGTFAVDVALTAKLRVKVWGTFRVRGPKVKLICNLSVPAPGASNASPFQSTDCKFW